MGSRMCSLISVNQIFPGSSLRVTVLLKTSCGKGKATFRVYLIVSQLNKNRIVHQWMVETGNHDCLMYLVCSAVGVQGEVTNSLKLEFVKNLSCLD